jgi:hypothetical protein
MYVCMYVCIYIYRLFHALKDLNRLITAVSKAVVPGTHSEKYSP